MPQVPSGDDGNVNGLVHSHRFLERIRLCHRESRQAQYESRKNFLQDKQLSVDIFAISPAGKSGTPGENEMASRTFDDFRGWRRI